MKKEKEVIRFYLDARFDARKSFYNKAEVEYTDANNQKLFSYGTLVAEIKNGKFIDYGRYSQTTTRHQREFARQNGFE